MTARSLHTQPDPYLVARLYNALASAPLCQEAAAEIERLRAELAAAQERGRSELRRYENLWRLAYKIGPVMLDIRGGHGIYRTVTVGGVSYNIDDLDDLARLEAVDE